MTGLPHTSNSVPGLTRRGALRGIAAALGGAGLGLAAAGPTLAGPPHAPTPLAYATVRNGPLWHDTAGNVIQAHAGHIVRHNGLYYWYGEDKAHDSARFRAVSCYSSTDLVNWTFVRNVLDTSSHAELADAKIERPKVIRHAASGTFVLWGHYERGADYALGRVAVATSPTPTGPFTYRGSFRPLEQESRDMTVYVDRDGTGYLLSASRRTGGANDTLVLFRLTDDYLGVADEVTELWPGAYREAPALFRHGDTYYLITSGASGWMPNQAMYATAPAVTGPWSDLAPLGDPATFASQSAFVLTVGLDSWARHILVADRWRPDALGQSRTLWLPLDVEAGGGLRLDWRSGFGIDAGAARVDAPPVTDIARGRPATASSAAPANPAGLAVDGSYTTRWIAGSSSWPAWWGTDLGGSRHVSEVNISWPMVKGSEGYYRYRILHSDNASDWTTIDRTGNTQYGFTHDAVDFTARHVRVELVDAVLHNNPGNWYTPSLFAVDLRA
ncbi:family 43 glycosylhydrolase [Streptomyces sp. 3MP-14]|uniref:Family 43 glycosylhydrolase n=1 Tax=Streptomyces mimosae TaxID=2586635 RepID=A0A5N5ZLP8_9ACTN|nr:MULTISPECIES: family 43 glycosylhydrolase [Streptomyces]KAB8157434.1 family 43 glycosylhydrolase [Streptomyces mimosae]KAB8172258.1 family 43 glycosylhydrolase [Streptomyces sp. 3MP-14]